MKKKLLLSAVLLIAAVLAFTACSTAGITTDDKKNVRELTIVVTAENISQLEQYPNLKRVDLSGSTCYEAIAAYMKKHPDVDVTFTVGVGGTTLSNKTAALNLAEGSYDFATLVQNLPYLTGARTLHLPKTTLTNEQLAQLQSASPNLALSYTIEFAGGELDSTATKLILSDLTAEDVDGVAEKLSMLPNLTTVELEGGTLPLASAKKLKDAAPQAAFNFSFQFFGKTISTTDTRVELVNVMIGDEYEQDIRDALTVLTDCSYFLLDNCGLSNEVLAKIREDFPNTEVVWRIFQTNKNRSWLTDTEVLRAVYGVDDTNSDVFKYCTKVKYLDFGHNEKMHDLSFLSYMPDLEIAILSGSEISDLKPLSGLKKLEFLELGWCGWLKDISPLTTCEGLKYLNLSHTKVSNVTSLAGLPLEMLHYVNSGNTAKMTEANWKSIESMFPGCWVTYSPLKDGTANPYGKGWRYNEDNTYTAAYKKVRDAFDYDAIDDVINNGGSSNNNTPTTPNNPPVLTGDDAVKKVTQVVTAETISDLEKYKNLQEADLSGSTCYDAILLYMKAHPTVKVTFTIPLGGSTTVKNTVTNVTLTEGSYDYDTAKANLKYITGLKYVNLPSTTLSADKITALKAAYVSISINYTMATQGTEIGTDITSVDLSNITPDQVDAVISQLASFPNVVWAELTASDGSNKLSIADVKKLQDANPNVVFHYSFKLYGKTVSTTDEKIEFVKVSIGNAGESTIREALDILKGCRYFKLDNCGLSNEVLAGIRDDYTRTKLVWRVFQTNKSRSWLTDTEVLRAVYGVNNSNSGVFKYCTDVKYMDFGHNTEMVDISFMGYMPNLEIAILSGSPIKDLSPLANCKKLEFLEIAWCGHVTDISPLAQCDSLRNLNLGHTNVKDLSPLYGLNMEMLSYVNSGNRVKFTEAHWQEIQANMPGCWITYNPLFDNNATPYGTGWRYKTSGGYTAIYRKVRDVFGYDEIDKVLQGNK